LSGWVLRELKPAFSPKGYLDPRESPVAQQGRIDTDVGSVIVVPVLYRGEILGTLTAINSLTQPDFAEEDVTLMEAMANQAATASENARLFEQHQQSLKASETRARQLQAAAAVSRAASSTLEMDELLRQVVALIREQFNLYYVGIFLVDEALRYAILSAGTGEAGREMLKAGHRLEIGGESMIGWCVTNRQARIALDVGQEAVRFDNPFLPETHSEMALPLISQNEVIGAMTIQSVQEAAFSEEDIVVLQTMADQLANAIANARLFTESQSRFEELQKLQRQMTGEAWAEYAGAQQVVGYTYDLSQITPLETPAAVPNISALSQGEIVTQQGEDGATLLAPITLHGESIGWLNFEETEGARDWSADDIAVIEAVREQLALTLENRLLFEQTATALAETSTLYEIGQHISEAQSAEDILQATVEGLSRRPEPDYVMAGVLEPPKSLRISYDWMRIAAESRRDKIYPLEYWQQLREVIGREGRFVTEDVENEPRLAEATRHFYRPAGLHGMAAFPLRVQNEIYGTLQILTTEPHEFSLEELRFYETVIQSAAVALENRLLLQTTQQEAARRALLNEVIGTAAASLNPEELLYSVSRLITERLSMPTMIWLWDGKHASPTIIYRHDGTQMLPQEELALRPAEMPGIGKAIRTRDSILWKFAAPPYRSAQFEHLVDALSLQEIFAVPLMIRDTLHGVMVLGRQVGHTAIDDNDMTFMRSAAVNIGVALDNATLYQDAQETAVQLREVDRLKSEFLANMSHELRTPLNSIIGFSRVILKGIDGPITEFQKTDLEAIYESGRHLLGLINDILDISKIEAGKMEFIFEPVDLKKLIKGTLATSIALVKDKPIELQQDVPEELPIILADERRIRQVVLNLLGNAAKFTEVGFIRVFATYNDREVVVGVKDTGVGIPPERYSAVFREFEQVDSSSTRSYGGTGLGLPVTKKFVEAHGGRIWFESEVGVGSTFYVALPIAGPAPQRPEDVESQARADENLTVLTVDDDEGVITLFRRYLEKQGYRVVGLTHSKRVVEEAKRLQPYAITLDIIMPDKNGWEVIQELKSDPETRDIPIIVCSIVSDTQKGLSLGVADYLVKPILEQDLLDALERFSEGQDTSHVLVVDDNIDDRKLLRRILEDAGYVVREAPGGAEAIVMIIEQPPDLVVLDLMMPEVDGFAVLENLKEHELTRQIPVVVVTAKELTAEEQALLNEGVESLLQKAIFDQEQLLQDVAAALRRLSFAGT
ncbi:MAG: GAF domain-containing protein, partial [Chloroflexota bacterium]|nr:GAF domain-containing protein [Chloroflexota bacterium]